MSTVVNKITFQVILLANTPDYLDGNWLINPVLPSCDKKFWKLVGDEIQEMTQIEKDDVIYSTESTIYLIAEKDLLVKQNGHNYEGNINALINPVMPTDGVTHEPIPLRYTKVVDGIVVEMTTEEKAVVDLPDVERVSSRSDVTAMYASAIADLRTIQAYTTPTNAQVIAAVKREAEILEKLLIFAYRNFI